MFRGVRYDALVTHMARDQWDTTEKRRTDGTGQVDRTYTRAGETKVYRSMLEVARAHYPELLTEEVRRRRRRPPPPPRGGSRAPRLRRRRVPACQGGAPRRRAIAVGDAVEARLEGGPRLLPGDVIGVRACAALAWWICSTATGRTTRSGAWSRRWSAL